VKFIKTLQMFAVAGALSILLAGCGVFRTHTDYQKAAEARPLEIPPDLDAPATAGELIVPSAGSRSGARASSESPPSTGAPTMTPPAVSATLAGNGLHVADTVGSTWQRVGLALERAKLGAVVARDESAHTYVVEVTGSVKRKSGGWLSRVFSGSKNETVTSRLSLKVDADGNGSKVSIEGDASDAAATDSAQRVVDALKERLS
jgi:uncharacterized lipoprotein